jgi:hypothetical protein
MPEAAIEWRHRFLVEDAGHDFIFQQVLPEGERERWKTWVSSPATVAMVKQMGRWTCQSGEYCLPCCTS